MEHLILPLTKSSWRSGRIGPVEMQDWYIALKKAKELLVVCSCNSKILVLSDFQAAGCEHEVDCSLWALHQLGVSDEDILVVREARETIEQLAIAQHIARERGAKLVIISTGLHYPRVRWLARGVGGEHYFVVGIPRPRELLTDFVLMFLFPVLDCVGARDWFLSKVKKRRLSGKH